MGNRRITVWMILLALGVGALRASFAQDNAEGIVVTTSMLATAVREVVGDRPAFHVMTLMPPGACPGHFDLKPDVLPALRQAVLVIRHDYQQDIEKKLTALAGKPIRVLALETSGSLLVPDHYLDLLRRVTDACSELDPENAGTYQANLCGAETRLAQLDRDVRQRSGAWVGQPVVAAVHQADYARYLGFEVAGVLKRTEDMTPRDVRQLQQVRAVMVIGNYQSNAQGAAALGKRMHLPVAMASNFPGAAGYGRTYEELVRHNLEAIEKAWAEHD